MQTVGKDYAFPDQEQVLALQEEIIGQYADKVCDAIFADLEVLWKHAQEHGLPHPQSKYWAGCRTGEGGYTEVGHTIPEFGPPMNRLVHQKIEERLQSIPDRKLYRLGRANWSTSFFLHKRIYHA